MRTITINFQIPDEYASYNLTTTEVLQELFEMKNRYLGYFLVSDSHDLGYQKLKLENGSYLVTEGFLPTSTTTKTNK